MVGKAYCLLKRNTLTLVQTMYFYLFWRLQRHDNVICMFKAAIMAWFFTGKWLVLILETKKWRCIRFIWTVKTIQAVVILVGHTHYWRFLAWFVSNLWLSRESHAFCLVHAVFHLVGYGLFFYRLFCGKHKVRLNLRLVKHVKIMIVVQPRLFEKVGAWLHLNSLEFFAQLVSLRLYTIDAFFNLHLSW